MIDIRHGWNVSFKPIVLGFVLSVILTLAAYRIVSESHLSCSLLAFSVIAIGCVQALIQLIFFLQLGLESKPRWNLLMFLFGVILMAILIGGSIWIMHNLDYNAMLMTEPK